MDKLIVILGPTASGKSDLAVKLARRFYGEIISADSRQVYKGLDIGSGKITKKEMKGVPHHLLDIANPKRRFTVAQYQKLTLKKIKEIQQKDRAPFLVGGTGFYIQSIVDGIVIPEVKPDWKLREKLESKKVTELYEMLLKLDPERAKNIDAKNPRRLIRALEIVVSTGKPVPELGSRISQFNILQIGVKKSPQELKKLIHKRLKKRITGIITEVKKLHLPAGRQAKPGLSWKRLEEFGLEYRFTAQYLQGKLTHQEILDKIQRESEQFAKRQMTWFKRDKRIHWIKTQKEAEKLIKKFLQ
ncbi:MAG: tRNA (adenosine(37)-N6)-dimethylallyltransferase MiaA [bacterium]|nr:tRNA (adenosine(37)-N6)-dimethylallyltransferase MiaA [bacterium]